MDITKVLDRITLVERAVEVERNGVKERIAASLAVSTLGRLYGCCGLLDMCGDGDLMSLSFPGAEPFLDVLGWTATDVCKIHKDFIPWVRANRVLGVTTAGYVGDACADPNSAEFSTCSFELEDFGRLRRASPTRDITKSTMRYCETSPRVRWDGRPITDDMEFGMRLAMEVLLQDLKRYVITGNASTQGLFDGLEQLIDSTYYSPAGVRCKSMDSIVVDWNGNAMAGGAGITWNGVAVATTVDLIDLLLAIFRRIKQRLSWAPALASQGLSVGDMVLVMPTNLVECIKDLYTCWTLCTSSVTETYESRAYRNMLNGGPFGAGHITLDGFDIPLIAYDWGLQHGASRGDIYFLTLKAGNVRLLEGQYNNLSQVPSIPGVSAGSFVATDGGRFLTWAQADHTCVQQIVEFQPRLLCWAPWSQARIMDVACSGVVGPISPDPEEASYFIEGASVDPATCPNTTEAAPELL